MEARSGSLIALCVKRVHASFSTGSVWPNVGNCSVLAITSASTISTLRKESHAMSVDENSTISNSETPRGRSWFKAFRDRDADELIELNPLALVLVYVIAKRAQWSSGFNRYGLQPGEAMIGDHEKCGMTRQQYRTAKQILQSRGFATFKSTVKGTIAKLTDTRIFGVLSPSNQPTEQPTPNRQPTDAQPLPIRKEGLEGKTKVGQGSAAPTAFAVPSEQEFTDYCISSGLGLQSPEGCQAFWDSHQNDGWMAGGKRIRDWRKALHAFVVKFQDCQGGEYSPPPPVEHGRYAPTEREVIEYCSRTGFTPEETGAAWRHYDRNGWVVETLPDIWTRCDTGPNAWHFAIDTWLEIKVGPKETHRRLIEQQAKREQIAHMLTKHELPPTASEP